MRGRKSGFILQSLEKRLMFSSTPASPRPDSLGSLFNGTQRQALLNRLTHLDSTTKSTLQSKLNLGKIGAFDSTFDPTSTQTINATVQSAAAAFAGGTVAIAASGAGVSVINKVAAQVYAYIASSTGTGVVAGNALSLRATDTSVITATGQAAAVAASFGLIAGAAAVGASIAQNTNSLGESRGLNPIPHPAAVAGLHFTGQPYPYYLVVLTAIVLALAVLSRLTRSRVGQSPGKRLEPEPPTETPVQASLFD